MITAGADFMGKHIGLYISIFKNILTVINNQERRNNF
jgi:hypothetical protein